MADLLPTLKTETQLEHTQLEDKLDLFNKVTDLDSYKGLLKGFYTIYAPLEQTLGMAVSWESTGWNYASDLKTPWLEEDLLHLGETRNSLADLPQCSYLPSPTGLAAAIGCLYVLEGSTLGGQVISSRYHKSLGITPDTGGRFFTGYGAHTAPHWREFGAWVRTVQDGLDYETAVKSAKQTFHSFDQWLNSPGNR